MRVRGALASLFLMALLAVAVLPSAAEGSFVVGSNLANAPNANGLCGAASCTVLETASTSPLKSPTNGVVVSWSTLGGSASVGTYGNLRLRILRGASGGAYTAVRSGPATSIPTATGHPLINTPVSPGLQISQNDYVALDVLDSTSSLAQRTVASGFGYAYWSPPLSDGSTLPPDVTSATREDLYQATIEPTNTFARGAITRNKKKGTATITLTLPNPGELTGSGKGAKVASTAGAVISKSVSGGAAHLLIKAKGKKRKTLNETGKVKLNVAITYTPTGGAPHKQSTKVKLKKRL